MRKDYRWINLSKEEIDNIKKSFSIIPWEAKEYFDIKPFFSITLTQSCPLKCKYCGEGGECTLSKKKEHDLAILEKRLYDISSIGINKIRLTGGEPFLYKDVDKILKTIKDCDFKFFVLINTNGIKNIRKYARLLSDIDAKLVVHLDTIRPELYSTITNSSKSKLDKVCDTINLLNDYGVLHRLNIVISKYNKSNFFEMINFAKKYNTNIKAFDVCEVPKAYTPKSNVWVPIDDIIQKLEEKSEKIFDHWYAQAFGTPVKIYKIDGILVSIKYTKHGSRYNPLTYCKECSYFPCDEGLYDILYYPDDTVWGCRWRRPAFLNNNFLHDLTRVIKCYQRARWFIGNKFVEDENGKR
jgi:cyclic pyranopterin phosphate synthase